MPQSTRSLNAAAQPVAYTSTLPALGFLHLMMRSREGDRREAIYLRQGKGWFQVSSMGHEALAAIAYSMRPEDFLFPYYRDRAFMLARGYTSQELALDYLARTGSSSEGRNMPAHCTARDRNIFSVTTPTGSQCMPAVGAAWGFKLARTDQVAVVTIGDAATREGEFYEAVAAAVQDNLPIVFVVEDNQYGISTPTAHMLPFRLNIFNEALVTRVNGRDALAVFDAGRRLISNARNGLGPAILWCEIDRLGSHTSADDQRLYRPAADLDDMPPRDPIKLLAERLIADGDLTQDAYDALERETAREIDAIYRTADAEPLPSPAHVMDHLYGPPVEHAPLPLQPEGETDTMVSAINRTFRAALQEWPNVLMYGEDIEDPKGGVFGFTKGLSTDFGGRVINSALTESNIIGAAVGLAATGYRPVVEIQFIDFITPGFNQLVVQAATLRWRSAGDWSCPLVIYAPYGAYLPAGGIWHSQSNDGWWAHIPGLRVAIPSTPEDAAGLFWAAMQDEDPSLILVPKHVFRVRMPARPNVAVPFGKAAIRKEGSDVSLVSWGNCVDLSLQAAESLAAEGISAEVLDLRTIVPCDWRAIEESLAKTGRLVVVHEDTRTCGFGQAIIAEMTDHPQRFYTLNAPPQLIARPDVNIPFCPSLELSILPDLQAVLTAVHTTLE